MVSLMKAPKELETLSGLFGSVTSKTRPFLDRCSETKYLAVTDYNRAITQYFDMAKQVLEGPGKRMIFTERCKPEYSAVRSALESGQLSPELIDALQGLRNTFVREILKPAMKEYMNSPLSSDLVEGLYESALRIDGLLEIVQFFGKVQKS